MPQTAIWRSSHRRRVSRSVMGRTAYPGTGSAGSLEEPVRIRDERRHQPDGLLDIAEAQQAERGMDVAARHRDGTGQDAAAAGVDRARIGSPEGRPLVLVRDAVLLGDALQ